MHGYPATTMRRLLSPLQRYIATPKVAKHRFFVWLTADMLPSNLVIAIASDEEYVFGVLSSSVHELWVRQVGSQLRESKSGGTYTPTTCFETFPFPHPTSEQREDIANAARELDQFRQNWRAADPNEPSPASTTPTPLGLPTHTPTSTKPSPTPTAGLTTSPTSRSSKTFSPSTSRDIAQNEAVDNWPHYH